MPASRDPSRRKSFRLLTLGGASLVDASGRVVAGQRRRVALLALVATSADRGVSRDRLIALLSPESRTESARHALHQLLYYLRQQIGADALNGTDPIRLNELLITFDVADFERCIERGELEAAASIYRGPFLDGFHLADSVPFDEWASGERARLAARYLEAVGQLAGAAETQGDHTTAHAWWRAYNQADPVSSRAVLGIMRSLAASGDLAAAVNRGRAYESFLREEFDSGPDEEVSTFLEHLRGSRSGSQGAAVRPSARDAVTSAEVPAPATDPAETLDFERVHSQVEHGAPMLLDASSRVRRIPAWLAVALGATLVVTAFSATRPRSSPVTEPSIAIAAIRNDGADSLAYLSDGLQRAIVDRLSAIRELRVIPPGVVGRPVALNYDPRAIGRATGAAVVLMARLTGDGDSLALHVELRRGSDGGRVLDQRYALDTTRIVALESSVADTVKFVLGLAPRRRVAGRKVDGEAFALVMRARYYLDRRDPEGLKRSRELLLQAIDRDPAYADAWSTLAAVHTAFSHYGLAPAPAMFERARAAAERALQLDPGNAQAISTLAHEQGLRFWRWKEAERELRRAVAIEPWNAPNWLLLGTHLRTEGRFDEARSAYRRARDLEPLSRAYRYLIARTFLCEGELDSALIGLRDAASLGATYPAAHRAAAHALTMKGEYDAAIAEWRIAMREARDSAGSAMLDGMRGRGGLETFRMRWGLRKVRESEAQSDTGFVLPTERAENYAIVGDVERALYWLERARVDRDPNFAMMGCRWEYDVLRQHPRFQAMIREMGLSRATFGNRPLILPMDAASVANRP